MMIMFKIDTNAKKCKNNCIEAVETKTTLTQKCRDNRKQIIMHEHRQ